VSAWADLVGAAHVAAGTDADAVDGVIPAWVVRPGSVAEVQACVRVAAADGAAVVASGLGAHLDVGARPRRLDVLVRLDRLARVVDHEAADMTVTVEAGCPLATLAATLAAAGQWLPLDPPRPEATTVGGLLAANLSGPLRAAEGTARDLLIGIRTVGADGALVAGGGRVVKNVAGYDLPKLHVGALGTLAVVVEATFKVRPRPEREEAVVIACGGVGAAAETALAVLDGATRPLWLEVAGPDVLAEGTVVAIGLGGIAEEVAHGRAALLALAGAEGRAIEDGAALRARLEAFAAEPAAAMLRAAGCRSTWAGSWRRWRGTALSRTPRTASCVRRPRASAMRSASCARFARGSRRAAARWSSSARGRRRRRRSTGGAIPARRLRSCAA
jgi:glycolate oxidase FAD binding subunit